MPGKRGNGGIDAGSVDNPRGGEREASIEISGIC
jgi:hypothetical protein